MVFLILKHNTGKADDLMLANKDIKTAWLISDSLDIKYVRKYVRRQNVAIHLSYLREVATCEVARAVAQG